MCNLSNCVYSFKRPWTEQFCKGGEIAVIHLGIAMTAGGLYALVRNDPSIFPGIAIGATVSLSIDGTHKLSHLIMGDGREGLKKYTWLFNILFAGIAIYFIPKFLKVHGYDLKTRDIAPLVGFSLISIAGVNKFHKELGV